MAANDGPARAGPRPTSIPMTAGPPTRGVIRSVTGRSSSGGKGLPAIHELDLEAEDGTTMQLRPPRSPGEVTARASLVASIEYAEFPVCPICLTQGPTSREHVPQQTVGGQIRTLTCERCNNGLGSRIETHLLDWYDHALRASYSSAGVPGRRRGPRLLRRELPSGEFVLFPDVGHADPAVHDMLVSGELTLHVDPLDMQRVRLAAMKHAYLAACLLLGGIPFTDEADRIREALVAARDASPRDMLSDCAEADRLVLARTGVAPQGPPLALMLEHVEDGPGRHVLSLAGTIVVSWPFMDIPPQRFEFGGKVDRPITDLDPARTPRPEPDDA